MKTAYKWDENGFYIGEIKLYESPREPGVYPMVPNSTLIEPNNITDKWNGSAWEAHNPTIDIEVVRDEKRAEVYQAFLLEVSQPVTIGDYTFDGGLMSIDMMHKAIAHAEIKGITERYFYETDETRHMFPVFGDAEITGEKIAIAIGDDYDAKDAIMREKLFAVNSATTVEDLTAIEV